MSINKNSNGRYNETGCDKAHSKEFSEDVYNRAAEPKELYLVPDVEWSKF